MKIFFFKYYGIITGALVGVCLSATYQYLLTHLEMPDTQRNKQLLSIVEYGVPSVQTVFSVFRDSLLFFVAGLSTGLYAVLLTHFILTVVIYSILGFCIHYLLIKIFKGKILTNNQ